MGDGHTRTEAARAGLWMKSGKFLSEHKAMSSYRVRELKMTPTSITDVPLLIDGDPWGLAPVHVKMHQQKVRVFCKPPLESETPADPIRVASGGSQHELANDDTDAIVDLFPPSGHGGDV
eukprot:m.449438 g.449438  ORF g.449438 m.449438 type:complete len:120 (-) comp21506_c1_seq3:229-588(-)